MSLNDALSGLANHGLATTVSAASGDAGTSTSARTVILMFVVVAAIFVLTRSFSTLRGVAAEVVPIIRLLAQVAKVAIMTIGVVLLLLLAVFASYAPH